MNFLAHDQVWNRDDWLTIAIAPPGIVALAWLLVVGVSFFTDRGAVRDAALFSGAFFGSVCVGAMVIIWTIVGITWAVFGL